MPVERVVFNAITKRRRPRRHDATRARSTATLVDAYLARRALDYLVGFTLSPVLWRKLPGRPLGRPRSVRGASPGLRPRERDRGRSSRGNTGAVAVDAGDAGAAAASSRALVGFNGKKLGRLDIPDEATARAHRGGAAASGAYRVASVEAKPVRRNPAAAVHHLDPAAGGLAQARLRRRPHHAGRPAPLWGIETTASRRSPTCGPTASQMAPEALAAPAPDDRQALRRPLRAGVSRASTRPRPRTRRRPTKPSARPIFPPRRIRCRGARGATRPGSTS